MHRSIALSLFYAHCVMGATVIEYSSDSSPVQVRGDDSVSSEISADYDIIFYGNRYSTLGVSKLLLFLKCQFN